VLIGVANASTAAFAPPPPDAVPPVRDGSGRPRPVRHAVAVARSARPGCAHRVGFLHSGDEVTAIGERIGNRRTTEVMAAVFEEVMERKYSSPPSINDIVEYSKYLAR
jgi:hypothetical protein